MIQPSDLPKKIEKLKNSQGGFIKLFFYCLFPSLGGAFSEMALWMKIDHMIVLYIAISASLISLIGLIIFIQIQAAATRHRLKQISNLSNIGQHSESLTMFFEFANSYKIARRADRFIVLEKLLTTWAEDLKTAGQWEERRIILKTLATYFINYTFNNRLLIDEAECDIKTMRPKEAAAKLTTALSDLPYGHLRDRAAGLLKNISKSA